MTGTAERSAARLAAVQALYQMDVAGKGVIDSLAEFEAFWIGREVEGIEFKPSDTTFFRDILSGVVREQRAIDVKVDEALCHRLAVEASRGGPARHPACGDVRASLPQGRAAAGCHSRIRGRHPQLLRRGRAGPRERGPRHHRP
jgi:hypothetical protein